MRTLIVLALIPSMCRAQILTPILYGSPLAAAISPVIISSYSSGTDNAWLQDASAGVTSPSLIVYPKLAFVGGSNNCAVLIVQANSAYTVTTPTDNTSETWVAGPSISHSASPAGMQLKMYYILGDTAGTNKITVAMTGTSNFNNDSSSGANTLGAWLFEVQNCGATIGGNGTLNTAATGSAINMTLSAAPSSGDMVLSAFVDASGNQPLLASITAGSGFTAASKQLTFGKIAQYNTATTSTTVPITFPGTDPILGLGIVIKKGPSGNAPPATKYIAAYQVDEPGTGTTQTFDVPCGGNLIVGMLDTGSAHLSSISGSTGTWSIGVTNTTNAVAEIFYGYGVTFASTTTVTPVFNTAPSSPGTNIEFACVANAAGTPFDNSSTNSGSQATAANLTTCTITAGHAGDIVFCVAAISFHTLTATVTDANSHTPTALFSVDSKGDDADPSCTTSTPNSTLDEDNGFAFVLPGNTTAISFIFSGTQTSGTCTTNPTGVAGWGAAAAAFQ